MEDRRPNNYHWTYSDISGWVRETIQEELESRGHKVKNIDVDAKVCQRMNNLGMVYTVGFDTMKDGVFYSLKNFYSVKEPADGLEDFDWFLEFFAELQAKAILQFGSRVLDVARTEADGRVAELKEVRAVDARHDVLRYTAYINCSTREFKDFMTKQEFIEAWTCGEAQFGEGEIVIGGVTIQELREENGELRMRLKMEGWPDFSEVAISLEEFKTDIRVTVVQKKIPLNETGSMELWWRERVMLAVATSFGFVVKPSI
jgi:activator of HSP90 ATPase